MKKSYWFEQTVVSHLAKCMESWLAMVAKDPNATAVDWVAPPAPLPDGWVELSEAQAQEQKEKYNA